MFGLLRYALSAVVTVVLLWAFFFIPVGGRLTLWQHTRRIMGTPEAQELGTDLRRAGHDVSDQVRRDVIPTLMNLGADGGVRSGADAGAHPARRARAR
ncbi:MAG: hypothetical protein R3A52_11560 [Polyangiales bacterium]